MLSPAAATVSHCFRRKPKDLPIHQGKDDESCIPKNNAKFHSIRKKVTQKTQFYGSKKMFASLAAKLRNPVKWSPSSIPQLPSVADLGDLMSQTLVGSPR